MPPHPIGNTPSASRSQGSREVSEELKLSDIARFVRRRRNWIILGAILGVLGGWLVTAHAPRLYTSTTTVELNKDGSSGLGIQDLSGIASQVGGGQEFMTDMLTHQAVLLNANTALSVIAELHLMNEHPYSDIPTGKMRAPFLRERGVPLDHAPLTRDRALRIFRSGLRVDIVKNTRLMTISYTDTDALRSTNIANSIVQAYLRNHTESRYVATSKASEWLSNQLDGLKRKVEESQRKVSSFQQRAGIVGSVSPGTSKASGEGPSSQGSESTASQRLTALNAELSRAEVARIEREAVYRLTQTSDPNVILGAAATSLATGMENSPLAIGGRNVQLLQTLREQAALLKVRLAADQVRFGPRYPALVEIRNQIDSLDAQSKEELRRINGEAKTDFLLAKANEDAVRKSVDEQQRAVVALGNSVTELIFLQQEENTSRGLYQDLYTRLAEANIAAGVKSTDMVVVDPARPPSAYSSPILRTNLGAGLVLGLFLGLVLGLLLHLRDHSLQTPEDFGNAWHAPMLGIIPRFASRSARSTEKAPGNLSTLAEELPWLLKAPKSKTAESYRQIRTSLLLSNVDTPPKAILFTSAVSGEGKSTTAYNLAVAFGFQSERVVLLDADLRRPTIREKSMCLGKKGLSDLLANDLALDDVLQQQPDLPSLSIITAGTIPPLPAELLGSQRFSKLIGKLRQQFDYILIDSPPALLVTDPLLIASSVDGIAVVLRSGVTTGHSINALADTLAKASTPVLGYVINDFDASSQHYGSSYGYGVYGKSGYYE